MPANDKQVGGDHYGGGEFQHWDYVAAVNQSYHAGCASKYVARWRKKHGKQDLEKALHYVEKCKELRLSGCLVHTRIATFWRFVLVNELNVLDAMVIFFIQEGDWEEAGSALEQLLSQTD